MRRLTKPITISLSLLLLYFLSGCSTVKLVYPNLDLIIPHYVDDYIALSDQQQLALDTELRSLLVWHCNKPLKQYSGWIRRIRADIEYNRLSKHKIAIYTQDSGKFWLDLTAQVAPRVVNILYGVNQEQVQQLFEKFNEKNVEYQQDYIDISFANLRLKLAERMQSRLENWLDDLNENQIKAIQRWSYAATRRTAGWVKSRLVWQEALRGVLTHVQEKEQLSESLMLLIRQPDILWTASYRLERMTSKREIGKLLLSMYQTLTPTQREYLLEQLDTWIEDIESLSCEDTKIRT